MNRTTLTLVVALLASALRSAGAQLSLGDALRSADRFAYGNRVAAAHAATAAAQTLAPLKGILPNVRFETGYVRTTDPIGVFGTTLRQRDISTANFDPQRLNHPDAVGNYQGAVVIEQPLFNGDAWAGRAAAQRAADASRATADWTRLALRVDVIRAYYGAVLAAERVATLTSASRAAHAHVSEAQALMRQGLVTKSDVLLASVRVGDVDARLAEATGNAETARRQLALLLGREQDDNVSLPALPAALPDADHIRTVAAIDTGAVAGGSRSDVVAASRAADAARSDAWRARFAYLPHINSFARYDWNSAARLYAGDRNWTVGIMASWNAFAGASDVSDMRASAGRTVAARAEAASAEANARLQVEETRTALVVALTRLALAQQGVAQSAEAHRIVARKYEGGLATVVELLDAQAVETQSALGLSEAQWRTIVSAAERELALGHDPASLAALDASLARATVTDLPATQPLR